MSFQSQYIIVLYRDVNLTKNRCHQNIACPLGDDINNLALRIIKKIITFHVINVVKVSKRCRQVGAGHEH